MREDVQRDWDSIDAEAERVFGRTYRKHAERRDTYGKEAFEKLFARKSRKDKDLH